MNVELMKRMMDACYLAQRVRGMLPPLPAGVTPAYIHYLDIIEMLEKQGVRAKISDISDALDLPRPGVCRYYYRNTFYQPRCCHVNTIRQSYVVLLHFFFVV